ncbi:MAG: ATP-binding cassette domain-containing protein [Bryobacteraceae bacterium]|nr:ATP-binding cassette domain-containing protein [Bryobacteraceae bacterium]
MPAPESILRFDGVSVIYDGVRVLDHVSFTLAAGETRVILGAAGAGKTVLLKTALGLISPDEGRVSLFNQEITGLRERQLFAIRAQVGMLFQESALFDSLTIEENVAYPLENQIGVRVDPAEVLPRVEAILKDVELGHTLDKFPNELSGGMRRRVGIARANVTYPKLVFYDSPTAGLDPITANNIMSLVIKQRDQRNTTTVIVSHRLQDGALMANYRFNSQSGKIERQRHTGALDTHTKFMVLQKGRLVFEGSEDELHASPDPYVAKFVLEQAQSA